MAAESPKAHRARRLETLWLVLLFAAIVTLAPVVILTLVGMWVALQVGA